MTTERKATQENQSTTFDMSACMAMMQEMMSKLGEESDSSEIISQMSSQDSCSCMEMMSSMFRKSDEEDTSN
jgi:hypothetical protein